METPRLSVVIPMYNEGENVRRTVAAVIAELEPAGLSFELVCVNDGSSDDTLSVIRELAAADSRVREAGHPVNRGRGAALRAGYAAAAGEYVVAIDADLSYHPRQIMQLVRRLEEPDAPDIVLASPYMPGGRTEGVAPLRLFISRAANVILRQAMGRRYWTMTSVFRAYRRRVFECLELYSEGKDIHLETLAKAEAAGLKIVEVPAVLASRKRGKSKLKFRVTALSHLMFSFYEKPVLLFGVVGLVLILAATGIAGYLFHLWLIERLNPTRPIVWLSVILLLAGLQIAGFAFISTQVSLLRRELYRTQKEILLLRHGRGEK